MGFSMLDWLLRVLGLGAAKQAPGATTRARSNEPTISPIFPTHEPAEPEGYDIELLEPTPAAPPVFETPVFEHPVVEPPVVEHPALEPPVVEPPALERGPAPTTVPDHVVAAEPVAPAALQFAAFALQSSAGARVFVRPDDGRLVHETGNPALGGWEVHGFVTDAHPGILFVLAAEGPTGIAASGDRAVAHAFRIEESGEDAFALFDLATEAYLCAPRFLPDVNPLVNDRAVVEEWEMFHLVAVEGVTLPPALPPLLPPAGTPITATTLQAWRRPAATD